MERPVILFIKPSIRSSCRHSEAHNSTSVSSRPWPRSHIRHQFLVPGTKRTNSLDQYEVTQDSRLTAYRLVLSITRPPTCRYPYIYGYLHLCISCARNSEMMRSRQCKDPRYSRAMSFTGVIGLCMSGFVRVDATVADFGGCCLPGA
jgi:hypothetical protein